MNWNTPLLEIENLREQVATLTKERDEIIADRDSWEEQNNNRIDDVLRLADQLAAMTKERDAAFAMSKCECAADECCRNLVAKDEELAVSQSREAKLREALEDIKFCTAPEPDDGSHREHAYWIATESLANPATILELCALLETAEKALKAQVEDKRDGPFFHEDEHPKGSCLRNSEEVLIAIKQWKAQT